MNTVTPHYPLQGSFEGISPLWPSWPVKEVKLFSISPKTRSLRFTLVLGYRGLIWLQGLLSNIIVKMSASTAQRKALAGTGRSTPQAAPSSQKWECFWLLVKTVVPQQTAHLLNCVCASHDTVSDFLKGELSPRTRWKLQ